MKKYKEIIEHYENCLEKYGDTHLGVDWPKLEDVDKRYKIMLGILDFFPKTSSEISLLDFGCGTAHLKAYIDNNSNQLIKYSGLDLSEKFVIYDDVAFIKQGWINRNNILLQGKPYLFTVPVKSISSFTTIRETIISDKPFKWELKLLTTLQLAYSKAPYFSNIYPLIEKLLLTAVNQSISTLATESIFLVAQYLKIPTNIVNSSSVYNNHFLNGAERVIDICKKENATDYINPVGGITLYNKECFQSNGINLHFLKATFTNYRQFNNNFQSGLSIIDLLMFNHPEEIKEQLTKYMLI